VEFDRERKEINASKRIQSQVNSIKESFESDFSSPGSNGQQSEGTGQDYAVPAWARKSFTLSDGRRQWDNTTNPNLAKKAVAAYNSGKRDSGPYKGQPQQKETRNCYFCGQLLQMEASQWTKSEFQLPTNGAAPFREARPFSANQGHRKGSRYGHRADGKREGAVSEEDINCPSMKSLPSSDVQSLYNCSESKTGRQIFIEIKINKNKMLGLIDSGSGITIGDSSIVSDAVITPVKRRVLTANGDELEIKGETCVNLEIGNLKQECNILLARGLPIGTHIIGNDIFKRFKLKLNDGNNTMEMDGSGTLEFFYEKDRKYEFLNSPIKRDPYEMFM
jgi:hypothetical protein